MPQMITIDYRPTPDDPVCDFCFARPVVWSFETDDFSFQKERDIHASHGGWAACAGCKELVLKRDRQAIYKRSCGSFFARNPDRLLYEEDDMDVIARMHSGFWTHWSGKGSAWGEKERRNDKFKGDKR